MRYLDEENIRKFYKKGICLRVDKSAVIFMTRKIIVII